VRRFDVARIPRKQRVRMERFDIGGIARDGAGECCARAPVGPN
jgi:hypothetical protein